MSIIKRKVKESEIDDYNKIFAIIYDGYIQSYLNPNSLEENGIIEGSVQFKELKHSELTELKIFEKMSITDNETHLIKLDYLYTKNSFALQRLWNKNENENEHKFWLAPSCKCNKEENEAKFPNGNYIINKNCLIHRHRLK